MPWTPHDLPFVIERAIGAYRGLAEHWSQHDAAEASRIADGCADSASMLDMASLTWLDQDMCDMVGDMWTEVPDWTPAACVPNSQGIMAFASPLFTGDYHAGEDTYSVPVRALGWRVDGTTVRITAWCWSMDVPASARSTLRAGIDLEELFGVTLPMDAVVDGAHRFAFAHDASPSVSVEKAGSALMSVAGATWLVMSQPKMVVDAPITMNVKKRRSQGRTVKVPVRVSVRSLTTTPRHAAEPTGRKATSRWWVRGHWRQQPWGRRRALRKPIFIAPHTAGNPDAPIDRTPKVQVWTTGQEKQRQPSEKE